MQEDMLGLFGRLFLIFIIIKFGLIMGITIFVH